MYEVSEAFHRQYADMYDKFVRIHFKDGSVRTGLFNDEFYDDSSFLSVARLLKLPILTEWNYLINKFKFGELRKSKFVMVDNMEWFNVFGLIFIAVIMIPNVVFAIKCKDGFDNKWNNKYVEVTEQVGRLGCFGFMIINIPGTWFGWWSDETFAVYLIVDTILVMLYCAIWIICFKKNSIFRALALSIIPSMLFLFSGIMSRSVLLIIASVLFAPSHIVISYKNVK